MSFSENAPVLANSLFGRDDQLNLLNSALDDTQHGLGRSIFITGEPGIGKSRLVKEVARQAQGRNLPVLWGRAVQGNNPVPFRPISEALLYYLREHPLPDQPELEPFKAALGRLIPSLQPPVGQVTDTSPVLLAEGVIRLLRAIAGTTGCLLVLEDLHWADPESLAITEYLSDNLQAERVVCLATLHAESASPALKLAGKLEARRAVRLITLEALPDAKVDLMAASCLGVAVVPGEVRHFLKNYADGNPFLVEELLAMLIRSGALAQQHNEWRLARLSGHFVPRTFTETIRERLDTLGETPRKVLYGAAVLGRYFDWTFLPAITGLAEPEIMEALRQARDAQLIEAEVTPYSLQTGFRFRHALTRDAVLNELLPPERIDFSRKALETVQAAHPDLSGNWVDLAGELAEKANLPRQAAVLWLLAGRRALKDGALATAEITLQRAGSLPFQDLALQAEIDEILLETLSLAGKTEQVFQVGEALLQKLILLKAPLARQATNRLLMVRAAVTANNWPQATTQLEQARLLAEQSSETDRSFSARLDALAAHITLGLDWPAEADLLANQALLQAKEAGLPEVECEALEVIGRCARLRSLTEAEVAFDQARQIAEDNSLSVWRIRALHELGTIDMLNVAPLDRLIQTRELAWQSGALATAAVIDLQIGAGLVLPFENEKALETLDRCAEIARRFHLNSLLGMCYILKAIAYCQSNRLADMDQAIEQALAIAGTEPDVAANVWGGCRAYLSLIDENRPQAMQELDKAMEIMRSSAAGASHPFRSMWVLLKAVEGPGGEAACAELLASVAMVARINRGYYHFAQAVLQGRAGQKSEAAANFARADEMLQALAWYRQFGRRLVAEAALKDRWGDPVAWLRESIGFFESQGQERVASACRALLRQAGVPVPRQGRGMAESLPALQAAVVTTREIDVLLLLAEGLSNREIGSRLYLSPRTVEKHVSSLIAKTGSRNRGQLTGLAARLLPHQN